MKYKRRAAELMTKRGCHAVGVGFKHEGGQLTGERSIVVTVREKVPLRRLAKADRVPPEVDGVPTDVIESDAFVIPTLRLDPSQVSAQEFTARERPVAPGVSGGHPAITAGTCGFFCVDEKGLIYLATNNHVGANSNDALIGDPFLQPGPYDGGNLERDEIAPLKDFEIISFDGDELPIDCPWANLYEWIGRKVIEWTGSDYILPPIRRRQTENKLDAAIIGPMPEEWVERIIKSRSYPIAGVAVGQLGDAIEKTGRTTEYRTGTLLQEQVMVNVGYGDGKIARYTGQFMFDNISAGGDSGSAILKSSTKEIISHLYAGSDTNTIGYPIQYFVERFYPVLVGA